MWGPPRELVWWQVTLLKIRKKTNRTHTELDKNDSGNKMRQFTRYRGRTRERTLGECLQKRKSLDSNNPQNLGEGNEGFWAAKRIGGGRVVGSS